jgi:shikimate kinase
MKQIIILIGLKGSGKTYIGTLLQKQFGIMFFRVEDIWLSLKSERFSKEYILKGMSLVEREIDKLLENENMITIESTGATNYFKTFLDQLKAKYHVKLVKIRASPETCRKRVKSRDPSTHIPVSDDRLEQINREALKVEMKYDLIIDNEKTSDNEILDKFKTII